MICRSNSSQMITGVLTAEITMRWKGNNSKGSLISSGSKWNSGRISKDNLINSAKWKGNSRCSKDNSSSKASQGSLKGDRTTSPGNLKTAAVEMTMAEVMAGDFNDI